MAITQEFREAVQNKDTRMVRIMLKDSLVVDPTFSEFNQMITLAETNIDDLYDIHNAETLNYDMSSWTKDYMDDQMVQVVYNFSKERIQILKYICKHLYSQRVKKIEAERKTTNNQIHFSKKEIGTGMVVGAVVATAVGLAIAKPVIIATGVAIGIAGGILIAIDN